jgi:hypothetical protein
MCPLEVKKNTLNNRGSSCHTMSLKMAFLGPSKEPVFEPKKAIISTTTWEKANKMLKPVIPRRIEVRPGREGQDPYQRVPG